MKAFTRSVYGGPEVLTLQEVNKPELKEDQLLVKVMANSANPADWHILRGKPFFARFVFGLFKPKNNLTGADFAGIVSGIGSLVKEYKIGDRVFGEKLSGGAFAEYTAVSYDKCARMPEGTEFKEMAAVPIAGLTALQALITHGKLKKGESVLVNGSSGGVGHFTVQIAKAYGAKVIAVCSSKNEEFVRSLGADDVIAYDREDIRRHNGNYDLIVDTHGNLTFAVFKRMGRRGVITGFTTMGHMISVSAAKAFSKYDMKQFTAEVNRNDLETLASLIKERKIKVHIDKIYPFEKTPEALSYIEAMHTRGKVVMVWGI
ncbi:MAG TPA: NAD(P)-dependent alcohol dehydrogenase [Bacteroidales bacterium]|nr:NAD(P)-dependent alcohol dehydrogenase [Bacteroidales bacterium]